MMSEDTRISPGEAIQISMKRWDEEREENRTNIKQLQRELRRITEELLPNGSDDTLLEWEMCVMRLRTKISDYRRGISRISLDIHQSLSKRSNTNDSHVLSLASRTKQAIIQEEFILEHIEQSLDDIDQQIGTSVTFSDQSFRVSLELFDIQHSAEFIPVRQIHDACPHLSIKEPSSFLEKIMEPIPNEFKGIFETLSTSSTPLVICILISGPSGSGKTYLCDQLQHSFAKLKGKSLFCIHNQPTSKPLCISNFRKSYVRTCRSICSAGS